MYSLEEACVFGVRLLLTKLTCGYYFVHVALAIMLSIAASYMLIADS